MTAPAQKMGFEGQLFIGATPGTTGATQLTNAMDITYTIDNEEGDTTVRGVGTTRPINTSDVTASTLLVEWTMIYDINDAGFAACMAAASGGSAIAVRTRDYSAGKGFDGDCSITAKQGMPLKGATTIDFSAKPSRGYGRDPQSYV